MNVHRPDALLSRQDAALVIIDIQERLLPAISNRESLLANTIKLLRFAGILGLPIVASEQIKLGPLVPEIRAELPDLETTVKVEFDALKNGAFAEHLAALNRNALVVAGIEAHICVAQTVLHALPHYRVHVISDAIGSRSPDDRAIALERLRSAGAIISSTEMLMYELLERAGTDEFREVLKLVKDS